MSVVVAVLSLIFVVQRFKSERIDLSQIEWPATSFQVIGLVVLLMLLNWSLEAWRWSISIQVFEKVSFLQSLRTVLMGLAMNWVLPLTSGDALSRLMEQSDKHKTAAALVLNRAVMLSITCTYGLIALVHYGQVRLELNLVFPILLILSLVVFVLLRKHFTRFWSYFHHMRRHDLIGIVGISLIRYAVFVFQFFLVLRLFLPELTTTVLLLGIGWIFFFRSILPSIFGGFGVREASGLIFFASANPTSVIIPIFIIWIVNSAIPSLLGAVAIWTMRVPSNT